MFDYILELNLSNPENLNLTQEMLDSEIYSKLTNVIVGYNYNKLNFNKIKTIKSLCCNYNQSFDTFCELENLEELHIESNVNLPINFFPKLTKLFIRNAGFESIELLNPKKLLHLTLLNNNKITDNQLFQFTNLEVFESVCDNKITNLNHMKNLKTIKFDSGNLEENGICELINLTMLNINHWTTTKKPIKLPNCKNVTIINLSGRQNITNPEILLTFSNLEIVDISQTNVNKIAPLAPIIKLSCSEHLLQPDIINYSNTLKHLELTNTNILINNVILPNVTILNINDRLDITNDFLTIFPNLEKLFMYDCMNITRLDNLYHLVEINIGGKNNQINYDAIKMLPNLKIIYSHFNNKFIIPDDIDVCKFDNFEDVEEIMSSNSAKYYWSKERTENVYYSY